VPWRRSLTDVLLTPIERPRCMRCRARMMLVFEPRENNSEKRTFECPRCVLIETEIVADPLGFVALTRLADSIKPPG
jgi:hypothetical protein